MYHPSPSLPHPARRQLPPTRAPQALLAAVPVERSGPLSDHGLLQRYLTAPQTAGDAFYQAALEVYLGLYAGLAGLVLDPMEGFRLPGGWPWWRWGGGPGEGGCALAGARRGFDWGS